MMTKVHMELPDSAVNDAQELTDRLHMRSKAATVTTALKLTNDIIRFGGKGGEVLVKDRHGRAVKMDIDTLLA